MLRAMIALRLLAAGCLFALGCGGSPPVDDGIPPPIAGPDGKPARTIDFTLKRHGGGTISLADLRRGAPGPAGEARPQAVLVTYFTTWCMPCLDLLPQLDRLDSETDGLAVLAISLDQKPRTVLPPALEFLRLSIPVALADARHQDGQTPFGRLVAVPIAYLVDPQGRHVETFVGITPTDYVRRRVQTMIEEPR